MEHLWWLGAVASLAASLHLLRFYRRPTAALAWLFALWALPLLGVLLYLMFAVYESPRKVRRRRRLSRSLRSAEERVRKGRWADEALEPGEEDREAKLAERLGALPRISGNALELHADPDAARKAFFDALRSAEREILIESFIWGDDGFTEEASTILVEKAAQGVRVLVLADGIGSRVSPGRSFERLRQEGVRCELFLAPNIFKGRFQVNFRNHRKLLVVDGALAVTGGRNCTEQYFDETPPDGIRDLSFEARGPVVAALRQVFIEDWTVATEGASDDDFETVSPERCGSSAVRVIPHGCDEACDVYLPIFSAAVRNAKEEVVIVSPYFVPDATLRHDLRMAASSGIRVCVLTAAKSPERWPEIASRRFYDELLEVGVEIWLRPPPFLHAKAILIDQDRALVGSANFDERSFYLNYELTCEILDADFVRELRAYFAPDFEVAERVDAEEFKERRWPARVLENVAALFAPIL